MSMEYLGESFDIHTGGVDNIFPHHTNEMAQSEGATGRPLARYWLHAEHLLVDGGKMSKSLGNYYTIPDLLDRGYRPSAIRYLLLSAHYRTQLNFTLPGLNTAERALERLAEFGRRLLDQVAGEPSPSPGVEGGSHPIAILADQARAAFRDAMDEDLSASDALAAIFTFVREANRELDAAPGGPRAGEVEAALAVLQDFDAVFGVLSLRETEVSPDDPAVRAWVEGRIAARDEARAARDYERADAIRREVEERGFRLEDTPDGTRWKATTSGLPT